ncbi:hypothetical protein BG46_15930 [Brucella anthropi]|uniref:hypothetical protein n=1 Tax=Brucella anthropi TaxID=529 RepID=UPI000445FF95|nr:hypothetical protein [Brucella anthropi]EXL06566.1 hypothetical protein BG46_15930 [Brucella anthropi]
MQAFQHVLRVDLTSLSIKERYLPTSKKYFEFLAEHVKAAPHCGKGSEDVSIREFYFSTSTKGGHRRL